MVEIVKGKARVGPLVSLIGGIIATGEGLFGMIQGSIPFSDLLGVRLPAVLLAIFGIIGLLLGFFAAKGYMIGNYITLILGIVLTLAWWFVLPPYVPEFTPASEVWIYILIYYLVGVGPILFIVGGLLGVVLKE